MTTHQLQLATIAHLDDGKTRDTFDRRIRAAIADMIERPGDDRARRVKLEIILKPDLEPSTLELRSVDIQTKVTMTTPAAESGKVRAQPRRSSSGGMLLFDDEPSDEFSDAGQ